MKSSVLQVCGLAVLVGVSAAAQQYSPYSPSSATGKRSSSEAGNTPNWPASVPQAPAQLTARIPSTPTNSPSASIPAPNMPAGSSPLTTRLTAARVELGPGDLLDIAVLDTPEVSGRFRVNADGEITMPLIGAVTVKSLPPEQAQALIARKLVEGNLIKDPQVTVFVSEYASQLVYVLGEVKTPGAYPLMGSHRLLDFVSAAGGLTPRAGKTVTVTTRANPDIPRSFELGSAANDTNPELAPGDSILISQAGVVYVIGDVARPGGFLLDKDEPLTLLQALALAEGTLPTAAKSSAKLIRTTAKGREEIPVNLKALLRSKATDLAMQDNDILFVPGSTTKGVLKSVQTVLPAAAAASVYRIP